MISATHLLSDDAVRQFIVDGHLAVRTELPRAFHQACFEKIEAMIESEGNWGNNILPMVPEIRQVYDDPAVRGALTRILTLEPDLAYPHAKKLGAAHVSSPGSEKQIPIGWQRSSTNVRGGTIPKSRISLWTSSKVKRYG